MGTLEVVSENPSIVLDRETLASVLLMTVQLLFAWTKVLTRLS